MAAMGNTSADDVVARLHLLGMSRDRMRSAMASALGVAMADIDALEYLERFGPLTQSELGGRLLLTSGAVTLLVDRLEKLGLVRRQPHPTDRRVTLVELRADAALPDLPEVAQFHEALISAAQALPAASRSGIANFLAEVADAADTGSDALRAKAAARRKARTPTA